MRMRLKLSRMGRTLVVLAGVLGLVGGAWGADVWPTRSLTLVVPFPAGGSTDHLGRAVAQGLSRTLGQSVVVENKGGAGGTVGAAQVMRSAPDGHTLLMGTPADQVNAPLLMSKPPYDPAREFAPIGCVLRGANVLVVNPNVPARSVSELIRLAKAQPGKLNYGSAGNGNTSHLSGELFGQIAGIDIRHVPYRGNAPAVTDTISGQVQMLFSSPSSVMSHIQSGSLRALAVTANRRVPNLPDTPSLRESGVAMDLYTWACLFVPAKTPQPVIARLSAALNQALGEAEVERAISAADAEKFVLTPEEARQFLASERKTWGDLIRSRNIQAD